MTQETEQLTPAPPAAGETPDEAATPSASDCASDNVSSKPRLAVLVPCYNEELTIKQVVTGMREVLPDAHIYVFDNNSTDRTAQVASEAGAIVVHSPRRGKGNVVRHMFDTVDADYYVMVDGDSTYPPEPAPELIALAIETGADMVVGTRLEEFKGGAFRRFHQFGNHMIAKLISVIFGIQVTDVLSGYRVFSRSFVRLVPLTSQGFEIETELTLQAAAKKFEIKESPIHYGERPPGSYSKLSTYGDGLLILKMIFMIFKDYKPLTFFGTVGILIALLSLLTGTPAIYDYITLGKVLRFPLAILAAGLGVISTICFAIGLLLHTIRSYHSESFELWRKIYTRTGQKS